MSNDLLVIIVWLSIFLISLISYVACYIYFIKKNSWKLNIKNANELNLDEDIIKNVFGTSNKLRCYLTLHKKHIMILQGLTAFPLLAELLSVAIVSIVLVFYGGTSEKFMTITFAISFLKLVVCVLSLYFLQNFLDKQIKKNVYVTTNTLQKPKKWLVTLNSKDQNENEKFQKLLMKYYQSCFTYIVNYNTFYKLSNNINYQANINEKFMFQNEGFYEISELSIYIAYITLINNFKMVNELLKYNVVDTKTQQSLTKDELIECLIGNVCAISFEYIKRIRPRQYYNSKQLIIDLFNKK